MIFYRPLDEDEDEGNMGTDDVPASRQKGDMPSWHVQDDSTADSIEMARNHQDLDRSDEDRISAQLRQGLTETKRAKLREIEVMIVFGYCWKYFLCHLVQKFFVWSVNYVLMPIKIDILLCMLNIVYLAVESYFIKCDTGIIKFLRG